VTITLLRHPPRQIIAGDSIEFLAAIPGDLAGWSGSARLSGPGSPMDATSIVVEGSDLHVKFEGQGTGGTKNLCAGQWTLSVWLTSSNDRYTVLASPITVTPDPAATQTQLAHAVETLAIIEKAIRNRLSANPDGGIEEYSVGGMQTRKLSIDQLEKLRNKYAAEVLRLQNPKAPIPRVKFVMTPAGTVPDMLRRFS
jgi:hypothetical protein